MPPWRPPDAHGLHDLRAAARQPSSRDIWRFSTYGARGDIRRLLIAAAAASAVALLMPVATGAILGTAIPDGRYSLLSDMLLLLIAAAVGGTGFQMVRAMALIRLGTQLDHRLQAAVWDRVIRLRMSFFRQYLTGDLAWRILGIDTMRRILTGQSVNGMIGGVFSLASLAIMLIYDGALTLFAVGYAFVAGGLLFGLGRAQMRQQRIVYTRMGIVSGLLIEYRAASPSCASPRAELRAFTRWSTAFAAAARSAAGALRATPCRPSPPRACRSSAPSASSASPPAATARSMSRPSPPSTAPSASSPPRS